MPYQSEYFYFDKGVERTDIFPKFLWQCLWVCQYWDKEEWREGYYLNALAKIINTRKYILNKEMEAFSSLLQKILLKRQKQVYFLQKVSLFLQRKE